jgi:hypothetical protein
VIFCIQFARIISCLYEKIEVLYQVYCRVRTFWLFLVVANKNVTLHSITLYWKKRFVVAVGFEPRIPSFTPRRFDHTTCEAVENRAVIFGQYNILKLLLENSSYRGGWKNKLKKMLWTCRVPLQFNQNLWNDYTSFNASPLSIRCNEPHISF